MDDIARRLTTLLEPHGDRLAPALLFGSRAGGTATPDSDIDLALLGDAPLPSDFKLALMRRLGREFGLPVDLIDLHDAPEPITGEALQGIRLLGDDETFAGLLIRFAREVQTWMDREGDEP